MLGPGGLLELGESLRGVCGEEGSRRSRVHFPGEGSHLRGWGTAGKALLRANALSPKTEKGCPKRSGRGGSSW